MKTVWWLIRETFNEYWEDKAERLGAALAFYAAFSLGPLLVLVIAIVDWVSSGNSLEYVHAQIEQIIGANAATAVTATIRGMQETEAGGMAAALGILTLLIAATRAFTQLQDTMNTLWEVAPPPRRMWHEMLRVRLLSFLLVLGMSILLLASLLATSTLAAISAYVGSLIAGTEWLWRAADFLLSLAVTAFGFALIYKILPDVRLAWSDVWIGAFATAFLFTLAKIPIGMYLGQQTFSSPYGAAGSLVVLLMWLYCGAQIFLLGAEFTQVYANRYGSRIRPARGAIRISERQRIAEGIPHASTVEEARRKRSA